MPKKRFYFLIATIVILGFLGGVVGELWLNSFLLPDPYLNFKSYSDLSYKIDELVANNNSNTKPTDEQIILRKMTERVEPVIVQVYKYKNFTAKSLTSLTESEHLGQGLIITSDGWVMTNYEVVDNADKFWILTSEHELLETETVFIDQNTQTAFLKIPANNFPTAEFVLRSDLVQGQSVYTYVANFGVMESKIKKLSVAMNDRVGENYFSSDEFYRYIEIADDWRMHNLGSAVFTSSGKVLGLVGNMANQVVPITQLTNTMKSAVKQEVWLKPVLGITFYDLSEMLNPTIGQTKGVLVKNVQFDSVVRNDILPNDIIMKIENEELDDQKSLPSLLAQYQKGDTVTLTIIRNKLESQVKVTLSKVE